MNPFDKYLSKEDRVQNQVINYVSVAYNIQPIPLNTESNKTPFERFKSKYLGLHRGIPDLFIPVPNKEFYGLFIELKADDVRIFKKDGSLRKNQHIEVQHLYHLNLNQLGYKAEFCVGFDQAKYLIDNYMKNV